MGMSSLHSWQVLLLLLRVDNNLFVVGIGGGGVGGNEGGSVGDVLATSMKDEIKDLKNRLETLNDTGNVGNQQPEEGSTDTQGKTPTREEISVLHVVVEKLQLLKTSAEARRESLRADLSNLEERNEEKKDGMKDYKRAMEVWKAVRDARGYVETMLKCYKEVRGFLCRCIMWQELMGKKKKPPLDH